MKLTISREDFSHAFNTVSAAAPARDVKEVLQYVKIVTAKNSITMQATDMEIGIRAKVANGEIEKAGEALLPARRMKAILSEIKEKEISLECTKDKVTIRAGRSVFNFPTPAAGEFPDVEEFSDKSSYYTLDALTLKKTIQHTAFATDATNARYSGIAGVLFEIEEEGTLSVVATDGRRLAYKKGSIKKHDAKKTDEKKSKETLSPRVVIHPKTLQIVERCIEEEGEVSLAAFENRAIFKIGDVEIVTRLIEGKFPNWQRILPKKEGRNQVDFIAESLHSALRQAAIPATEEHPGVILSFENGLVVLSANGAESGDSSVELPVSFDKEKFCFKIDPKFVREFLRVLDGDQLVSLFAINAEDAVLFTVGENYSYILMPLDMSR